MKHHDSLTLRQEGNNGNFFVRRRTSFIEFYQDARLNNALGAYRMRRRPSSSSTQLEISLDFNVDQDSVDSIVVRAILDPSPVRGDINVDEFPPPEEEHLCTANVCPRTPRRHRHHNRRRNSPCSHCTVPINPHKFENIVLAPSHQEPQNQVFFVVIDAVVIIISGAIVSNNNYIVIVVSYLLLLFFSFLAVFLDSFSKNNLFWQQS